MHETEEILHFIGSQKDDLFGRYRLNKIGLFGSYARGEATEDSDIDLIVEFEPGTENLSKIKEDLRRLFSDQFHKKVDICREKYIKPFYKRQILKDAIFV